MWAFIFIFFGFIAQFFIGILNIFRGNSRVLDKILCISCFIVYVFVFGRITETTDWDGYEYIFQNDQFPIDLSFRYMSSAAKYYGLEFIHVYQFHVILTGILLILFISRFTTQSLFITTSIILMLFIPLANQIRFFLSLSIFLNASYFLLIGRRKLLFIFLGLLSVITHFAIIPFFLFVPLFSLKSNKRFFQILFFLAIILALMAASFFQSNGIFSDFHFNAYVQDKYSTTLAGSLFNSLPLIIISIILYSITKKQLSKDFNKNDKKLKFLFRLSFFSFLCIPSSLFSQIILWRYCFSIFFVWILLVLRSRKQSSLKIRLKAINYILIFQWLLFGYKWYFPIFILDSTDHIKKVKLILESML